MIPFDSVASSVLCALINTCTIPFKMRTSGKMKVGNVSLSGISNFSFIRRELHTCTHTHTYVHARTHTNMHTHAHMLTCVHIRVHTHTCKHTGTRTHTHTHQLFKNGGTTE